MVFHVALWVSLLQVVLGAVISVDACPVQNFLKSFEKKMFGAVII